MNSESRMENSESRMENSKIGGTNSTVDDTSKSQRRHNGHTEMINEHNLISLDRDGSVGVDAI